jgi:hypothetical protein
MIAPLTPYGNLPIVTLIMPVVNLILFHNTYVDGNRRENA